MFTIWEILLIITIHIIGDFPLQTEEMAKKKNYSSSLLFLHVGTYTLTWIFASLIYCLILGYPISSNQQTINPFTYFCTITFFTHYIIDYFTSRMVTRKFKSGLFNGWSGGMTIIGYSQLAHYIQLFLTYYLIFK